MQIITAPVYLITMTRLYSVKTTMRNLALLNTYELQDFFNSFDHVLSDVDGVLWNLFHPIPGTQDAIKSLQKIGKKVAFVSNNTTKTLSVYHKELKAAGFDVAEDEIVTPTLPIISYLKKRNISKKIFVLGMTPLKTSLRNAGFKLAENGPDRIKESVGLAVSAALADDGEVGAVIADMDVNLNYLNLQKAVTFLARPEVLFLKGATDRKIATGKGLTFIGPGCWIEMLEDITGRKAICMAKPSPVLNERVVERFKIEEPSRVLFIGDSISQDMGFATKCGYQRLLVLSGVTKREEITNGTYPIEYKFDYYADSLRVVHDCILRTFVNKF